MLRIADDDGTLLAVLGAEAVAVLVLVLLFAGLASFVLLRASSRPPVLIVIALTLITFAVLALSVVTRDPEALTLAATGLGALAGAVSALFRSPNEKDDER